MSLLGINALWVGEMIWDKVGFNLLAIALAMILYTTLHKIIGEIQWLFGAWQP